MNQLILIEVKCFLLISFVCIHVGKISCVPLPQELQKPHFQVEHKAGVLDITATKDKATVDVKSDTIRLVVKPGDRQMPQADIPETKVVNVAANEYPPSWQKKAKIHH